MGHRGAEGKVLAKGDRHTLKIQVSFFFLARKQRIPSWSPMSVVVSRQLVSGEYIGALSMSEPVGVIMSVMSLLIDVQL